MCRMNSLVYAVFNRLRARRDKKRHHVGADRRQRVDAFRQSDIAFVRSGPEGVGESCELVDEQGRFGQRALGQQQPQAKSPETAASDGGKADIKNDMRRLAARQYWGQRRTGGFGRRSLQSGRSSWHRAMSRRDPKPTHPRRGVNGRCAPHSGRLSTLLDYPGRAWINSRASHQN